MGLFNRIIDKMVSDKVPFKKRKRLIVFVAIITLLSMNGIYQPVITAYREKVNAKAFFSLDIGIGVGMLIQVAHHGKESGLISVKAAPRMKAHIRFSVLFPSRDSKENGRYSCCYFKVGEQLKFFRIGWLKILGKILFNLDLHHYAFL